MSPLLLAQWPALWTQDLPDFAGPLRWAAISHGKIAAQRNIAGQSLHTELHAPTFHEPDLVFDVVHVEHVELESGELIGGFYCRILICVSVPNGITGGGVAVTGIEAVDTRSDGHETKVMVVVC